MSLLYKQLLVTDSSAELALGKLGGKNNSGAVSSPQNYLSQSNRRSLFPQ